MKKNKTLFLVSLLALSSCNGNRHDITIYIYDSNDTFISSLSNQIFDSLKNDFSINILDAKRSQTNQNNQIVSALNNNQKYLIINMVDRLASSSIISKSKNSNSKLIFFNREPIKSDLSSSNNSYYVGSNSKDAGVKQAQMVMDAFGPSTNLNQKLDKNGDNKIQMVMILGEEGHQDTEYRTSGFLEEMHNNEYNLDILSIQNADWDRDNAYDAMEKAYQSYGEEIELIICNNDDMALGAIDYLKLNGVLKIGSSVTEQPLMIIGNDGTKVGLEAIQKGFLYGTVLNDANKQSDAILKLINYLETNKSLADFPYQITSDKYIYINGPAITYKTINDYLEEKI